MQSNEESKVLRLRIIADIIRRARLLFNQRILTGEELAEAAAAWNDAITHIPTERLNDSFEVAVAIRTESGETTKPASYADLSQGWRRLREQARANTKRTMQAQPDGFAPPPTCPYCSDTGYQPVDQPERGVWRDSVRPCSCDSTPIAQRSIAPLREPMWFLNTRHRWQKAL